MGVDSSLRFWFENPIIRPAARPIVIHVHPTAAIGDVDAVVAVALHQLGLLRERVRRAHMAHQPADGDVPAKIACVLAKLHRAVCLSAVGYIGSASCRETECQYVYISLISFS